MNTWIKGMTMAATAALFALPASAQTGSGSLGLFGNWSEGSELYKSAAGPEFELDNSWGGGASLEFWMGEGRQLGLRFDGSYTQPDFQEGLVPPLNAAAEQVGASVWTADANLMLRLWGVDQSTRFSPFVSLGGGSVWFDPEDDAEGTWTNPDLTWTETEQAWAVTGGVGADVFFSESVALRLEVRDYYMPNIPFSDDSDHNIQYRAGLNFFWGNRARVMEPGFIQEEPETRPEPRRPEPEPAPATESITRCVVTPSGTFETVTATRYLDTNRTVVTRSGREVEFSTAYPATGPVYVRGASWYMNNGSMTVNLADDSDIRQLEFVTFGSASGMSTGNLVYVGNVNGTPLFATRSDVSSILPRLNDRLRTERDLQVILRSDADLARDFADVQRLYVAVEPGTDCVFQPISLTTHVRRTRG